MEAGGLLLQPVNLLARVPHVQASARSGAILHQEHEGSLVERGIGSEHFEACRRGPTQAETQ